jgi:hypothetical protein
MHELKERTIEEVLAQIARITNTAYGQVPRSYLFDQAYAGHRMSREGEPSSPGDGPTKYFESNLRVLFDQMSPEIRDALFPGIRHALFPGQFNLGNGIEATAPTKNDLLIEMQREGSTTATEYGFQSTRKAIAGFTGHHFDAYFKAAPSKALKVQKTVMLLKESSFSHAFDFLQAPKDGDVGSFEVADSLALQDEYAVSRVAFLADMKEHLRLEIPLARRVEIDITYGFAREKLNATENAILKVLKAASKGSLQRYLRYLSITEGVLNELSAPSFIKQPFLPLDEQMYIHCSSLEFLNYAAAWPSVYRDRTPTWRLRTLNLQAAGLVDPDHGPRLRIEDLPIYIDRREQRLLLALNETLALEVSARQLAEAVVPSQALLQLWAAYRSSDGWSTIDNGFDFSPVQAFVALVAVIHQKLNPTTDFQPFWHGKKTISGSLIAALENYRFSAQAKDNVVPEAFTRVWDHHFQWFTHSFHSMLPIYESRLSITRGLTVGLLPFIRHHDTNLLVKRFAEYDRLPDVIANQIAQSEAAAVSRPYYGPRRY